MTIEIQQEKNPAQEEAGQTDWKDGLAQIDRIADERFGDPIPPEPYYSK